LKAHRFSSFIGGDYYQIGYKAAIILEKITHLETRIIEVWGLVAHLRAQLNGHKGFIDAINKYPNLAIVATVKGDWLQEIA
jgi:ABC-type sugar transport system substrate-binding protein